METLLAPVGIVAAVLVLAALCAGVVERAPVSFPMLFLGLGLVLGGGATGVLQIDLHAPVLEVVAFTTLALVLFLDAVHLEGDAVRRDWLVPALTLGPGTIATIALVTVAARVLLDLPWAIALIAGAALASTDAVVLRDVLRDRRIPAAVRRALSIVAGTNDVIVLPVVLVVTAIATSEAGSTATWGAFLVQLFIVGPAIGAGVGAGGAWLMARVDARFGVRTEYQALYGVGLVLAALTLGETFGADGFLAAFAAGAAVALTNNALCDCFLDFGEVVAEMAMLLTFVLFGSVLSPLLADVASPLVLGFVVLVLAVARPVPMVAVLSLRRARLSWAARAFIAWFGPRGLNSLLLVLIAVGAGLPDGDRLFAIVGAVVVASVALHGATATPLGAWYGRRVRAATAPEEREVTARGVLGGDADRTGEARRITVPELATLLVGDAPPVVVDVRSRSSYERAVTQIPGSIRVRPDEIDSWAQDQTLERLVVLWCT